MFILWCLIGEFFIHGTKIQTILSSLADVNLDVLAAISESTHFAVVMLETGLNGQ